jgi:hypothetical protein
LAVYLLLLGTINLSRRPFLTTGARDIAALGIGLVGFVVIGPLELFLPERAAVAFGPWVWALMLGLYLLGLTLLVLLMRPRLVIYNVAPEQLRPALAEVVARLDPHARWAGDSLVMPTIGVQFHLEPSPVLKHAQLVAIGPAQNLFGWRQVEDELAAALKQVRGQPSPFGACLISFGLFIAGVALFLVALDPAGTTQALSDMLRR